MLQVAAIVDDTQAEGPGRRLALWVQGCTLRCAGCCNPELFGAAGGRAVSLAELTARLDAARAAGVEGLTVLGGEPFEQAAGVAALATAARARGLTVLVFSGHTRAELEARAAAAADVAALLAATDELVDGRYRADQPEPAPADGGRRWIGSRNQVVHALRGGAPDPRWTAGANTIEIRVGPGGVSVNGWPAGAAALRRGLTPPRRA